MCFDRGHRGLKTIDLEHLSVFDRGRRGIKTIDLEHLSVFDRGRRGIKTIDLEQFICVLIGGAAASNLPNDNEMYATNCLIEYTESIVEASPCICY